MGPDELNDLINAAPAIGAGALAAAIPFTAIVKRMLGPAADEVAEFWRDQVRLYRYGRQLKLLEKADRMAQDAGFTPQAVPPKILFPLLEGASFEDDEDLHTMWSALLANAASPDSAGKVRPGFIAILKQMAPDEAELLNALSGISEEYMLVLQNTRGQSKSHLDQLIENQKRSLMARLRSSFKTRTGEGESEASDRFNTCLRVLSNAGLVEVNDDISTLTSLGTTFLTACHPPKPKS